MTDRFTDFETSSFPADSCTIQNSREPDVFESDEVYVCLVRRDEECRLEHMRPCMAKEGHKLAFGWLSVESGRPPMPQDTQIWVDSSQVVAWKKEVNRVDQPDQAND